MLPKRHFDEIEKDAIDQINSSAQPVTKEAKLSKKVVEIRENAIERSTKSSPDDEDDDEYEYDYNYDDDTYKDDVVTATPKPISAIKC